MSARNLPIWSPPLGDFVLNAQVLSQILGASVRSLVSTPLTTVGDGVLLAAALASGIIARTGPTAAFTDTTDTAANIVTALGGFQAAQTFSFKVKNATAYNQTLAGGTGVTMSAAAVVPPLSSGEYFGTVGGTKDAPTVVFTHIDTAPIRASRERTTPQTKALTTVGAGTILADGIDAGIVVRSGPGAAFTDTTDTAALIIAGVSSFAAVGAAVEWTYVNNSAWPATLAGGVGASFVGSVTIPANSWAKYLVTYATASTVVFTLVAQGLFPHGGTFTANGATPVTVSDANVTAGSAIVFTLKTVGGTVGAYPSIKTITPGTGFTVAATASDSSVYNYEIRG